MTAKKSPHISDIQAFWDANPLWTGEAANQPGTLAFFEEHRATYHRDCFAGTMDPAIFPMIDPGSRILDLGCGIGFWLVEFWERGFRNLTGADLSPRSLEIAHQRCAIYGIDADLQVQNAECTSFESDTFDHVNCQGVIHHTVDQVAATREIHRILKPGGTASISVYYRNFALRQWRYLSPFGRMVAGLGGGLKGRGRESIMTVGDANEIVRLYDGDQNPIGTAYSTAGFLDLIGPGFEVTDIYYHFFPARSLPFTVPQRIHAVLDRAVPFMIYANLRKLP